MLVTQLGSRSSPQSHSEPGRSPLLIISAVEHKLSSFVTKCRGLLVSIGSSRRRQEFRGWRQKNEREDVTLKSRQMTQEGSRAGYGGFL